MNVPPTQPTPPTSPLYDSPVSAGPTVLIMAAGEGTRMRSSVPKVLHPVCGRPMVAWTVLAANKAGAGRIGVIVSPDRDISSALPDGAETIVQPDADGTGGAIRAALEMVRDSGTVLVLPADHALVSAEVLNRLLEHHRETGAAATVVTTEVEEPGTYGRIVRDASGDVERIVEAKSPGDASPEELAIAEINTSIYAFDGPALADALGRITNDNSQGEYYLGDVLPAMREAGLRVAAQTETDDRVNLGVNTRADLARVEREARRLICERHMLAGVTIRDPGSTWIDADVEIEADAVIEPGSTLRGASRVGAGSVVGPHTTLIDSTLGARVTVPHSYLLDCDVADGCLIGPFAHLRPGALLREGAKVGTFVEIKKSEIGKGAKVPHLTYIGDADVGPAANLGAGTITANYDGFRKHRTKIGEGARIAVHTSLVAPVSVGDGAYTGAGSVIADDVPPGALGISRIEQRNIDGYAEKKARQAEEEPEG
jgi:bifunctional UDP-N-acetylglucosamine pyrophosphorylase/glucosamine-1-phosphate N-acetyltransferase